MENDPDLLVGKSPGEVLLHGPSKLYIDQYLWFEPEVGVAASYRIKPKDVHDHFGVFRGVDMIESFAQTGISACTIRECMKDNSTPEELKKRLRIAFLRLGETRFYGFVKEGDLLVSISHIISYKFRQMVVSGSLYKVADDMDPGPYFKKLPASDFKSNHFPKEFQKIADIRDVIGKAIKSDKVHPQA